MVLLKKIAPLKKNFSIVLICILFFYFFFNFDARAIFLAYLENLSLPQDRLARELNSLTKQKIETQLIKNKYFELHQENLQLKKILKFQREKDMAVYPLMILGVAPTQFRQILLVSTNEEIPLHKDMFVLDEEGNLAGQILRVHPSYVEVILITDPKFSMTVRIGENLGLLTGTLEGRLKVLHIEDNEDLSPGDEVFAIVPEGMRQFKVGVIQHIAHDENKLTMDITVKPYFEIFFSQALFVVINNS